ncbi:MAG: phage integrase N-terminal SAM-like domain-containing protein [Myxococcales bacterium]|nr:phage integrase N-terminal SAM-like domain-containing protein [Myxococcales bacterium]
MGQLRNQMAEDIRLRGLCANTLKTYLRCGEVFVRHHGKSPRLMGKAEIRDFLLHLVEDLSARHRRTTSTPRR